jgi:GTPase Era involved in 16S rRNA processing
MPEPELPRVRERGELNDAQKRRLNVTCKYIDKLLSDIEQALHSATSQSPFPRYVVDITSAQGRVIEDHIGRLRSQLLRVLDWQHMKPDPPEIPVTRSALTDLAFIDIAIEELRPSYMRGCGAVPEDAASELNGVVHELRSMVESMERYLRQELGANLESRLRKLEETGYDVGLLQCIEEVVTRHGLVEFRPRIDSVASRLEDNNLEVALFGRVSSGKSSLLNALLGTDILPVGVNPITAVPTRLRYGAALRAEVTYASGRKEEVPLDEFRNLVSESSNPGNQRNVVRAVVEIPSPRLSQGIVLVDTPGLGSLARRGAAETMAYLPACDLAILLIDAGATLNDEDIGTLRLLYEGGIQAIVLLSKADLLTEADLGHVAGYIETQVQNELGLKVHIRPVSALADHVKLLDYFFEKELLPRFHRARSLRDASVARMIGALRESLISALETLLQRDKRETLSENHANEIEARLRHISGEVGEQRTRLDQAFLELGERPEAILSELAEMVAARIFSGASSRVDSAALAEWTDDVIQKSVGRALANTRTALSAAIVGLRETAMQIARSDMPTEEEAETLLRNTPRFEMASVPPPIGAPFWRWFGRKTAAALARHSLRQAFGEPFRGELHRYGRALSQWSEQTSRKMQALVNSYADAYRAQLSRIRGRSADATTSPELANDLSRLLKCNTEESAETSELRS